MLNRRGMEQAAVSTRAKEVTVMSQLISQLIRVSGTQGADLAPSKGNHPSGSWTSKVARWSSMSRGTDGTLFCLSPKLKLDFYVTVLSLLDISNELNLLKLHRLEQNIHLCNVDI